MALITGCFAASLPFSYIGFPGLANMGRIENWDIVVKKFKKRLANWKVKVISISGRLTLLRSILGSLVIYYMSLFKMPENVIKTLEMIRARFLWGGLELKRKIACIKWMVVLNSKDKGGLSVGSLKALNIMLLWKWAWRFFNNKNSIWIGVIKSIHGRNGEIDAKVLNRREEVFGLL